MKKYNINELKKALSAIEKMDGLKNYRVYSQNRHSESGEFLTLNTPYVEKCAIDFLGVLDKNEVSEIEFELCKAVNIIVEKWEKLIKERIKNSL